MPAQRAAPLLAHLALPASLTAGRSLAAPAPCSGLRKSGPPPPPAAGTTSPPPTAARSPIPTLRGHTPPRLPSRSQPPGKPPLLLPPRAPSRHLSRNLHHGSLAPVCGTARRRTWSSPQSRFRPTRSRRPHGRPRDREG